MLKICLDEDLMLELRENDAFYEDKVFKLVNIYFLDLGCIEVGNVLNLTFHACKTTSTHLN